MQRLLMRLQRAAALQQTHRRLQHSSHSHNATQAREAALQTLRRIAHRLPEDGYNATQLHALIEDSYPQFTSVDVGALTLREALQLQPQWFIVEDAAAGGWCVKPTAAARDTPPPPSADAQAATANTQATTITASRATALQSDATRTRAAHDGSSDSGSDEVAQSRHATTAAYDAIVQTCIADARAAEGAATGMRATVWPVTTATNTSTATATACVPFVPLEDIMRRAGVSDVGVIDAIVRAGATLPRQLDVRVALSVRPRRPPRGAVVFVDGEALDEAAVQQLCRELNLLPARTRVHTVRRPGGALRGGGGDVVAPWVVPVHLVVEREARMLQLRTPALLCDVVYMCGDADYELYCTRVAMCTAFPDADVYVCCRKQAELVQPKRIVPYVEAAAATAAVA